MTSHSRFRYYECSGRKRFGDAGCVGTTVREDTVLESMADHLENWLGLDGEALGAAAYYGALKPDDLPEAFAAVRELLMPKRVPGPEREAMEKQFTQLTALLAKARGNLILLDPDNIPAAQERIRQMEQERDRTEEGLRRSKPPAEKDVNAVVLEVLHSLYGLAYCCRALARADARGDTVVVGSLEAAAPKVVRRFLGHTSHVVCNTRKEGVRTRTRHEFEGGEMVFSLVGLNAGNLNPHPRA
jgi:hypothetical protein